MSHEFWKRITIFTWMQDDSNLRWPSRTEMSPVRKYFTINFIYLIHKAFQILQCVPLATEPSISLIILTPMKILQQNLNRSMFVVWEMKRNVSVVPLKFCYNILISGNIIKKMPGLIARGTHCICLYQWVSPSPSSHSVPSSPSHTLLTFPLSTLPFHNISSSVPSTTCDIQNFLKPFTVTSGERHCHAVMIHVD